ncbi:MAG TPA: DMT family transporter [Thermoanaerobaculia bacterium]|nr:DMT family transporter [Thermoanaerobaculia bacterium]
MSPSLPASGDHSRRAAEAFVAVALFGCIPVVIKLIAANAYTIGIVRLAIATAGMLAITAYRRELRALPAADIARLAVIGALFFGHWHSYFLAIKASSASVAAIGLSLYGVFLLILGAIFGAHRVRIRHAFAVVLAAIGTFVLVPNFSLRNEVAWGMLLAATSALFYASLPLLHQRWSHLSTTLRALGQFAFALLIYLAFTSRANWNLTARDWAGLLFLAIGTTLIAHGLWVRVTTRLAPAKTSIIYYGNIPFALALSAVVLHEPLTLRTLAGAVLIVGGSVLGLSGEVVESQSRRVAEKHDHDDVSPFSPPL